MPKRTLHHPEKPEAYLDLLADVGWFDGMPQKTAARLRKRVRDEYDPDSPWDALVAPWIDWECIYQEGDYPSLAKDFFREAPGLLGARKRVTERWEDTPGDRSWQITLSAKAGRETISHTFEQESDYVAEGFFEWLDALLDALESPLRFIPAEFTGDEGFVLTTPAAAKAAERAGLLPSERDLRQAQAAEQERRAALPEAPVMALLWPATDQLLAIDRRHDLWEWNPSSGEDRARVSADGYREVVAMALRDHYVYGFANDCQLLRYDRETGSGEVLTELGPNVCWGGAIAQDATTAWAGLYDFGQGGMVARWALSGKRPKREQRWQVDPEFIHWLALSPDDSILYTGGRTGSVHTWDPHTGEALRQVEVAPGAWLMGGALSPDGGTLAVLAQCHIHVFATDGLEQVHQHRVPEAGQKTPDHLAFSPDGATIAAFGGPDGCVRLYPVRGKGCRTLSVHEFSTRVAGVAFSPDGQLLAAGGSVAQNVAVVSCAEGKVVRRLPG